MCNGHEGEAERLRTLLKQSGIVQGEFAREHGFGTPGAVSQYLTGHRRLGLQAACKFARALRVDLAEISPRLAAELASMVEAASPANGPLLSNEYVQVPYVRLLLRSGNRRFSSKSVPGLPTHVAFRKDWLIDRGYTPKALLAIQAPDESMKPTITASDLIVLNTEGTSPEEGQVFAVNYEGQLLVRRMFRDLGEWWLVCDYQDPQRFPRKQHVERNPLLGKVVHRQSEYV
jgi:phage repressor protein C with HTH and peptisase S24 domain